MVVELARYFILQGYGFEQITILTPYSGQFFLIKKVGRLHLLLLVCEQMNGRLNNLLFLSPV